MALQSSGPISLLDVANEFGGGTPHSLNEYYGVAPGIPNSGEIELSDFYGANAGGGGGNVSCSFYENRNGSGIGTINVYATNPSGGLLSSSLYNASGSTGTSWFLRNTSSFTATQSFRLAWHHVNTAGFRGDYAIDAVTINGTFYSFENNSQGFVTTSGINTGSSVTAYNNARFNPVPLSTSAVQGRWNRNTRTTSSSTGPNSAFNGSFFLFTETTSPNSSGGVNFWLFSPLFSV